MSRIVVDSGLLNWEVYASGGPFGFPEEPKIVFHCLSDPRRRPRYVRHEGDNASAQRAVQELPTDALRQLLEKSIELD